MNIVTNHSWWSLFVIICYIRWTSCFKRWRRNYWIEIYMFVKKKTKGFKRGFQCSYQMNMWTWAMNFEREHWTCELDFDEQQGIFYEKSCHVTRISWHVYKNSLFVYVTIFSQLNQWNIQFRKIILSKFFFGVKIKGDNWTTQCNVEHNYSIFILHFQSNVWFLT